MAVKFHLPDFTQHYGLNIVFADMIAKFPEFFRDGVEIASVYGTFPPAIWNGGRFQYGKCEKNFIKSVINNFNDRGIPLRFTFTNPVIEKKHLGDKFCNMIMYYADNGMNKVIVASPVLEEYIRKNYPRYKITSSTCKRITDPERLGEELDKDYNIVVLDYDMNNRFEILSEIPHKEKCEILVNACCNPECQLRAEHYRTIGAEQIAYEEHLRKTPERTFDFSAQINPAIQGCNCMNRSLFDIKSLRTHISPEDIWEKYVPMGFSQFKIEGRTAELFNLIEHYMYYMVRPERRDEARLLLIRQLVSHGIIKTQF